ncbi:unnamed protein product [Citrullus colocynthis]|uniref:Uncharacterized protein n=1 Tax=Citrullus colocynthis TaxID=252529 RepID=A0ABP0Z2W4_9ROSI
MICPIYENCGPNLSSSFTSGEGGGSLSPFCLAFQPSSSLSPIFLPLSGELQPTNGGHNTVSPKSSVRQLLRATSVVDDDQHVSPSSEQRPDAHAVRSFRLADSLEQLWVTPPRSSGFFSSVFSSSRSFGDPAREVLKDVRNTFDKAVLDIKLPNPVTDNVTAL